MKSFLRGLARPTTGRLSFTTCRGFSTDMISGEYKPTTSLFNVERAYVGQVLEARFEHTIGAGWREQWSSCFFSPSRMHSSNTFANRMGFTEMLLPFPFLLNQAVGMSYVDDRREVLDLGFANGAYLLPCYAGDTFRKQFVVKEIRNTKKNDASIVTFQCNLLRNNTGGEVVFTVDKIMMFRGLTNQSAKSGLTYKNEGPKSSRLKDHILANSHALPNHMYANPLKEGQLILHGMTRPFGRSNNMALSSLFGMTHPTIFNSGLYSDKELVVPGALVISLAASLASRDLTEGLHSTLFNCRLFNKTSPVDTISALTYVSKVEPLDGTLEESHCVTVGLKNVNVSELSGVNIPKELFTNTLTPNQLEAELAEKCPELSEKVISVSSINPR